MIHASQQERRDDIRSFLKALRGRLHPDTKMLGAHERLAYRRGRVVTQEELAEAVGVSRGWYALLESGAAINPSVSLLDRIAAALKATPAERTTLFRLAVPALQNWLTGGSDRAAKTYRCRHLGVVVHRDASRCAFGLFRQRSDKLP
jgi:transcriptional regulator with XRE-family HTH domain